MKKTLMALRSQIVTSNIGRGGRRYLPCAFTEQGVAMLSSVLRSKRAVRVNIQIMRAFVGLRRLISFNKSFYRRLEELEKKHVNHDHKIKIIFDKIRQMMQPAENPKKKIGFKM